ncbi:hypothetical protein K440DRAFT_62849 [Wilcoxina mikolae CBS 423.85]|nr:hypothetical protein K440DRAFT_62849 [Wilcoxina mikolae CBS 423.85]
MTVAINIHGTSGKFMHTIAAQQNTIPQAWKSGPRMNFAPYGEVCPAFPCSPCGPMFLCGDVFWAHLDLSYIPQFPHNLLPLGRQAAVGSGGVILFFFFLKMVFIVLRIVQALRQASALIVTPGVFLPLQLIFHNDYLATFPALGKLCRAE